MQAQHLQNYDVRNNSPLILFRFTKYHYPSVGNKRNGNNIIKLFLGYFHADSTLYNGIWTEIYVNCLLFFNNQSNLKLSYKYKNITFDTVPNPQIYLLCTFLNIEFWELRTQRISPTFCYVYILFIWPILILDLCRLWKHIYIYIYIIWAFNKPSI